MSVPSPIDLQHEARAVVHVEHRDRQRRDERRRHRVVDDERVHLTPCARAATGSSFGPPQLMQCGWIDGGVLIVPQSTQRPPSRPSISSAPRTNIALSGGTPIGIVSPLGDELAAGPQRLGVRRRRARRARASATRAAPGNGRVDVRRATPVVRPPPVPTIATVPAASSAAIAAEQRGRRAGVADRGVDRGRRGRAARRPAWRRSRRGGRRDRGATRRRRRTQRAASATSRDDRAGRSLRGTGGRRRGRGCRSRRRRGSGRGTGGCA